MIVSGHVKLSFHHNLFLLSICLSFHKFFFGGGEGKKKIKSGQQFTILDSGFFIHYQNHKNCVCVSVYNYHYGQ